MKIAAWAALVMVAGAGACSAALREPILESREPILESRDPILNDAAETVKICSEGTGNGVLDFQSRSIATRMFAGIGVRIEWHKKSSCPAGALRVSYSTGTPAELLPGALAYALPYEGTHIVIFYDRVQATVVDPNQVTVLMAHVMAHEITHVLEGIARHSAEGVMKAHWTPEDYSRMCWKPLKFADEDIVLIHLGLENRAARRNAQLPAVAGHSAGGE
jgi:hypothetical protein